eukprot:3011231-Amphidinium_carterae.1
MVTDVNVIVLAQGLLCDDVPSRLLIAGGLAELSRKYAKLTTILGLQQRGFSLGTLRGGGAMRCLKHHKSLSLLQWLGRWSSERSTHHYLQLGVAAATWIELPSATKFLVQQLAELANVILNPFVNGTLSVNDEQKFFAGHSTPWMSSHVNNEQEFLWGQPSSRMSSHTNNEQKLSDPNVNNEQTFFGHQAHSGVDTEQEFLGGQPTSTMCSHVNNEQMFVGARMSNEQKFLGYPATFGRSPRCDSSCSHWGYVPATQTEKPSGEMAELSLLAAVCSP